MQKFNEYVVTQNLVEAILISGADVDALCEGILKMAKKGNLTQQSLAEAWYGKGANVNELFGQQAGRNLSAAGAMGGAAMRGVGAMAGGAGGWLKNKVMGGMGAAKQYGQQAMGAVKQYGQQAVDAGKQYGQQAVGAAKQYTQQQYDTYGAPAADAKARQQVQTGVTNLQDALGSLKLDPTQISQMLGPLTQWIQQQQQPT